MDSTEIIHTAGVILMAYSVAHMTPRDWPFKKQLLVVLGVVIGTALIAR